MRSILAVKFARWFLALSACLCFVTFASCGEEQIEVPPATELSVLVSVAGLTPAVSSLYVSTSLNGLPAQQGTEITGRLDQFAIYLPLETSGTLGITVVARSSERCLVSSGMSTVAVAPAPPTRLNAEVTLTATAAGAPKACALTVQVKGKGKVTSMPVGIDCTGNGTTTSECSFDFPVGTNVTLTPAYDAKSYGVAWSGACTGNAACSFQHQKPSTVTVGIAGRICSSSNWCWYAPLPQGNTLRGLWGSAADDVWAVGDFGTILHYDGLTWSASVLAGTLTQNEFTAVWGTSATDVWAVGVAGVLAHYDGKAWTLSPQSGVTTINTLRGVWGSSPTNYWAVGNGGHILRYDGTSWATGPGHGTYSTNTLYSVWGASSTEFYIAGSGGVLLSHNGTAVTRVTLPGNPSSTFIGVRGAVRDNVVVMGSSGIVYRFNGSVWAADPMSGTIGAPNPQSLWVLPSGSIWAAGSGNGARYSGTAWQAVTSTPTLYAVWAASDTEVWAVGAGGTISRFDGQNAYVPGPLTQPSVTATLNSIWGVPTAPAGVPLMWAVGSSGTLRSYDGTNWSTDLQSGMITNQTLYRVWGTGAANILAVGSGGTVLRFDTNSWNTVSGSGTVTTDSLYSLHGSSPSNIFIVGGNFSVNGALLTFNGNTLTKTVQSNGMAPFNKYYFGVYLVSGLPYAVSDDGQIMRYSGGWGVQVANGTVGISGLRNVWGTNTPSTSIFAVGYSGTIVRYNGSTWTPDPMNMVATTGTLYDVWGANATTVWAVGSFGTILRYNGTAWATEQSGSRNSLLSVFGTAVDNVWAVGASGTTLRYMP